MFARFCLLSVISSVALAGCAHNLMRGSVAMKTKDNEAHVCMGKGEVNVGDRVTLFHSVCDQKGAGRMDYTGICELKRTGSGTVQELLNDHYSVVKFDPGVSFDEKDFVQRD